ncbi:hypothetical protein GCM10007853_03790 [Algimonas ampicilliniresistens]|uniref:Flavodoxin n=1 Tax=Algimonas ampicilliniresistens TaxID=1298735 RepID=A0ABQ5V754_9PROT|nr:hypothetical protein [Algimonas ampicilliniresistens]GLQ22505.1 hypothetical protein GCM10007853_03790 [Algimonas ampicilliniresistens]
MKALILYYSRSGTTANLARAISAAIDAPTAEISCPRYGPGWLRYLRAGYDSVKGRHPPISVPDTVWGNYDLLILGSPIWTSYPALPLRAFLKQGHELPPRIALFFTYGGHSPPEKAVNFISDRLLRQPIATLAVQQERVLRGEFDDDLKAFTSQLSTDN